MMKTIYGMAKSYFDLKGSRNRNFELDFLRLALVGERDPNVDALYLSAPLRDGVGEKTVESWNTKYQFNKGVVFVFTELSSEEENIVRDEKKGNHAASRQRGSKEAKADLSRDIVESYLVRWIKAKHTGVAIPGAENAKMFAEIRWDCFASIS